MKLVKTVIGVFNIDTQKHIGNIDVKDIDGRVEQYRNMGYSVCVDCDGDICIDKSDDDNGLTYKEQVNELAQ